MHSKKDVLAEALALPPIERAALVEELLSSFEFSGKERLDRLWAAESEERIDAYERGELVAAPLESVFEKINAWKK
ncbi:addiction module protein [Geotalea toluenoxydans]|uniref:addiction module protein n=1 Tax=Geotalea toluenoxydans TaxID=421624 RepID=UPI0006CFC3C3|nr:addiction module protein [Geotalea toluenoxydans]